MGKSKKNSNFDSQARGMHRSEDDLGYLDHDDDMTIIPDAGMTTGESTNANTATMQAKKLAQETQTTSIDKRGNQPDR